MLPVYNTAVSQTVRGRVLLRECREFFLGDKRITALAFLLASSFLVLLVVLNRGPPRPLGSASVYTELRDDVTLVVHLSVDRIPGLVKLLDHWQGPIVAAFFLKDPLADIPVIEALQTKENTRREKHNSLEYTTYFSTKHFNYPVNILRNRAVQLVETSLYFMLDVDFMVDQGLYFYLKKTLPDMVSRSENTVFVVSAWEHLAEQDTLPKNKDDLVRNTKKGLSRGMFECTSRMPPPKCDQAPHAKLTDYSRWLETDDEYTVDMVGKNLSEPFVVLSPRFTPLYDERFVWYGNDKVQHLMHLRALGFKFVVIPEHFIVHVPHGKSSWNGEQKGRVGTSVEFLKQYKALARA